jgi:hypothetical protein
MVKQPFSAKPDHQLPDLSHELPGICPQTPETDPTGLALEGPLIPPCLFEPSVSGSVPVSHLGTSDSVHDIASRLDPSHTTALGVSPGTIKQIPLTILNMKPEIPLPSSSPLLDDPVRIGILSLPEAEHLFGL